jgi:glycosyltransferase involved in cell wall biosynthesis
MEGMARGLAIVATPVGAIESVVSDENGWLVEPGNVEAIAAALTNILESSPEELIRKRQASLLRITSFTWDNIARQTAESIGKFCEAH